MWQDELNGDALTWLSTSEAPGVRYLALRDLLELPRDDPRLAAARDEAHHQGTIAAVLAQMADEGYWVNSGPGYNPKYRSTVWAMLLLAQLGADAGEDARIERACQYVLDHALTPGGQFSSSGAPSGTIDCLQGNLCWALTALGCRDERLGLAFEWMARTVTGEGMAPLDDKQAAVRYYSYKCGPNFACGANAKRPCAWGAVKEMLALSQIPAAFRTPLTERATQQGIDFLFSIDPSTAAYSTGTGEKPNRAWWKFGFPVFYVTDLLQLAQALANLGCGSDPRLAKTLALIRDKQDAQGRWALDYDYAGKTWVDFGEKKQPNPWVTLRALHLFKTLCI